MEQGFGLCSIQSKTVA